MPNWCYTSYVVTGEEKEVRDLYEKMKSLEERTESFVENGFGKTWLGNLVTLLGEDWEKIYCRGWWESLGKDCDDGALRFDVESAWCELSELRQFLQEKYPSLDFYFRSEEPGMVIYETNDADGEYFPEQIKVEHWSNETEYFETWEEVYKFISKITGAPIDSDKEMYDIIEVYNQGHPDEEIHIHEFQIAES